VETPASLSFCAHSSQHTSTVLPPILTLIEFSSSLQSQAAHVLSAILLSVPNIWVFPVSHATGAKRCQNL
jgi:hypothetical protein